MLDLRSLCLALLTIRKNWLKRAMLQRKTNPSTKLLISIIWCRFWANVRIVNTSSTCLPKRATNYTMLSPRSKWAKSRCQTSRNSIILTRSIRRSRRTVSRDFRNVAIEAEFQVLTNSLTTQPLIFLVDGPMTALVAHPLWTLLMQVRCSKIRKTSKVVLLHQALKANNSSKHLEMSIWWVTASLTTNTWQWISNQLLVFRRQRNRKSLWRIANFRIWLRLMNSTKRLTAPIRKKFWLSRREIWLLRVKQQLILRVCQTLNRKK